jgi:hypothetical protein
MGKLGNGMNVIQDFEISFCPMFFQFIFCIPLQPFLKIN